MDRICCYCKNFTFEPKEDDWSENTPGADAQILCAYGHWNMYNDDSLEEFRDNIQKAEDCKDWKFFKD